MLWVVAWTCAMLAGSPLERRLAATPTQSGDVQTLIDRGHAALEAGRMDEAESAFERAVVMAPGSVEPHLQLGVVYLFTGRVIQAQLQFEEATAHGDAAEPLSRI